MHLSDRHLQEFIAHGKKPEKLARLLTEKVVEVEGLHRWDLENIVVGEVKAINPHPQADRLRLVETLVGDRTLTIVCGGKNLYPGECVAVALEGAMVRWHGQGDKVKLEPATIRGVKSEGMICAAAELDLPVLDTIDQSVEAPAILDLTRFIPKEKAGAPLTKALGLDDVRFEIDNKSLARRADLWGYHGMAREVSLITGVKQKKIDFPKITYGSAKLAKIEDKKGCWRYIAIRIDNVKVVESPWEVQRKLIQAGLRPINLIVDLTNLVMIEMAQPLHAFDARTIDRAIVRKAKKGEKLMALNGKEYALEPTDCVIANAKEPMALAGIMGGEHSGIQSNTTSIILESATFEPVMIRKTSQRLLLRSDSSARFEKGQPVERADHGARRFLWHLKQYQPGVVVHSAQSLGQTKTVNKKVVVDGAWLDRLIGVGVVPFSATKKILQGLGMKVTGSAKRFTVMPPFWRHDIEIPADVAEEVSRLYGFNIIEHALPTLSIQPAPEDPMHVLIDELKTFLVERCGFTETESYPFAHPTMKDGSPRLLVVSPIAQENKELRDDLMPAVGEAVAKNIHYFDDIKVFEIGRIFQSGWNSVYPIGAAKSPFLPSQHVVCAAGITRKNASVEELFLTMKGVIESWCLAKHWVLTWESSDPIGFEPGQTAAFSFNGTVMGFVGLMKQQWNKVIGCDQPIVMAHILMEEISRLPQSMFQYHAASQFPSALRDLAIVVDAALSYERVAALISSHGNFLQHFEFFDSYSGKEVGEGKKSLAFHLTFSDTTKTLTNQEVDASMEKLVKMCQNEIGATIR